MNLSDSLDSARDSAQPTGVKTSVAVEAASSALCTHSHHHRIIINTATPSSPQSSSSSSLAPTPSPAFPRLAERGGTGQSTQQRCPGSLPYLSASRTSSVAATRPPLLLPTRSSCCPLRDNGRLLCRLTAPFPIARPPPHVSLLPSSPGRSAAAPLAPGGRGSADPGPRRCCPAPKRAPRRRSRSAPSPRYA